MTGVERVFDLFASTAQVWVTFVLFALGVQFASYWLKTRKRLEKMRGSVLIDPPDLRESRFAALFASGLFAGTVVSFGVVSVEALCGSSDVAVTLAGYGCMVTGSYFAWRLGMRAEQKLRISHRPRYEPLRRIRLPGLLRNYRWFLAVLAVPLLVLALACPGPDPRTDLSLWGFAYRWTAAGPGLILSLLLVALFAEAARARVGGELKAARWRGAAWGSLGLVALWANHLLWPYVALYYPECWAGQNYAGIQRLLEAPIFGLLGVGFFKAFTKEFRSGEADKNFEHSDSFRRLSERISFTLSGFTVFSQRLTEDYYEASRLLEKTLASLGVGPRESQLAANALALAAAQTAGVLGKADLRRLHLHHARETRAAGARRQRPFPAPTPDPARRCPQTRLRAATSTVARVSRSAVWNLSRPPSAFHSGAPLAGLHASGTRGAHEDPRSSHLLARSAEPVVAFPHVGGAPDLPGRPCWQQAYVVVAAMSGLLPCPRASREVLDPRGKNHTLKPQRVAYQALLDLAGDAELLPHTRAYGVLADLFGEQAEPLIFAASRAGPDEHRG